MSHEMGLDLSRVTPCKVLYKAGENDADLAVLRTADTLEDRIALPLLDSSYELEVGDSVIAIGYPGTSDSASDDTAGSVERSTVTKGEISVFRPINDGEVAIDTIQHTATINHGNSGGPLVLPTGEVAGVNTWGISGSDGDTSTNNAIEIKYVIKVLNNLDIEYDVGKPTTISSIIIIGAVAAVIVIAVIIILLKFKPNNIKVMSSHWYIYPNSGVMNGRKFEVATIPITVGREKTCDMIYYEKTPGVSHKHCSFSLHENALYVTDLSSSYGTYVNGTRIPPNQPIRLNDGAVLYLGSAQNSLRVKRLTVEDGAVPANRRV